MRRAIDLVHYVVKDGIMHSGSDHVNDVRTATGSNPSISNRPKEVQCTIHVVLNDRCIVVVVLYTVYGTVYGSRRRAPGRPVVVTTPASLMATRVVILLMKKSKVWWQHV